MPLKITRSLLGQPWEHLGAVLSPIRSAWDQLEAHLWLLEANLRPTCIMWRAKLSLPGSPIAVNWANLAIQVLLETGLGMGGWGCRLHWSLGFDCTLGITTAFCD